MRQPLLSPEIFKHRRALLREKTVGSAVVIPAHPEFIRNHDVHHEYRQDTNLFYLTGFEEPNSVLVFRSGLNPETVLFVQSKDPTRETWDGFRYGPEFAEKSFGIDKCYPISELSKVLPELLKEVESVYYRLLQNHTFDRQLTTALNEVKIGRGRSGCGLQTIIDSWELLGEMRIFKSSDEISWMQKASEISAQAHINAMKFTRPGVTERQVQAVLQYTYLMSESPRMGYYPIVASGNNATTLHYNFNDQKCHAGDLLLIDSGTEWNYLSADITRTFPVNGRFSPTQRELYQALLELQKNLIRTCRVGFPMRDLQNKTIDGIVDILLHFGLLTGDKNTIIQKQTFKKYYPHGVSHWLGMDVHDAGLYAKNGVNRPLEPGMCLTIEPGIYIPANDLEAPKEFRGLGIRIEDDIIVTSGDPLNLTAKAPKEIPDIESIVSAGFTEIRT